MLRAPRAHRLKAAVLVLGLVALGLAARATVKESEDLTLPGVRTLLGAVLLTRLALGCSARAWVTLLGTSAGRDLLAASFYQSQLVKYLPAGGLVQAAGQVGMTAMHGISMRRAASAYVSLALATVAGGLSLAPVLLVVDGPPGWLRASSALGGLAPLLLRRGFLAAFLGWGHRVWQRIPGPEDLPDQPALWRALGWSVANHLLYAGGFTLLLRAISPDVDVVPVLVGYVIAWVAGFLVLPLPSGLGVREAVLTLVLPGVLVAPLLAASLAQRLAAILAEVAAALGNKATQARRRAQVDG